MATISDGPTREARISTWLGGVWRDVVFGTRILTRDKLFAAVALITLALGIGANAAIFSLLNGLLWRALPVHAPGRLVRLRVTNLPPSERAWVNGRAVPPKERATIPFALYRSIGSRAQLFEGVFGTAGHGRVAVEVAAVQNRLEMTVVTGSYFPVLGIAPAAGRLLTPDDDVPGGPAGGWAVVISDAVWSRLFGRAANAVGSRITVERIPFTVIGVAPPGFGGVNPGEGTELWLPLSAFEAMYPKWRWRTDPGMWMLQTMARLKPEVSIGAARAQLGAMSPTLLAGIKPAELRGKDEEHFLAMKLDAVSARSGYSWLVERYGRVLWTLMAAVGAVLLIAATNLTNLLLARSTARRQEIVVRLALGAPARRIRRQLLVESALLAVAGAAVGLLVARWLVTVLLSGVPGGEGGVRLETPLDWRVMLFLTIVLAGVVVVMGLVPAWSAVRGALHEGAGRRVGSKPVTYFRAGLVVMQMALSLTLLGGAGLLIASLGSLMREATGLDAAHAIFITPDLFNAGVSRERMPRVYAGLLEEARRLPGVRAAAWTMHVPLTGNLQAFTVVLPGRPDVPARERMVFSHQVTDGYFAAAGIPLLAGRDLPPDGVAGPKSSVVSENFARRFFGTPQAAIGQRLKPGSLDWTQIIGVAADAKFSNIREPGPMTVYTSYWDQQTTLGMTLVVNVTGRREPVVSAMQALCAREAGRLPFTSVRTLGENVAASTSVERLVATLLSGLALLAMLISVTGIAGLLGYAVQLRRREIGIRMAVGASPAQIARQFGNFGLALAGGGLVLGGLFSFWLRHAVDAYLFRVEAGNPAVWLAASAFLLLCAAGAAAIPARLAARLDPIKVLRTE